MFAVDESEHARAISRRTLNNIRSFLTPEDLAFVKDHPVHDSDNTNQTVNVVKTYTFTVLFIDFY